MTLSDISIKRPVGVFVLTLMIVVLGLFFLRGLSVDLLPRITYPMVRIIIDWKGASPEEVEENILKKVESSVATTEDAIQVISSSIEGNASIEVYFEFGKDMDVALADTRAKLDLVRNELPLEADEPKIYKADPSQLPILDVALSSEILDERALRDWAENDLSNYFLGIPGLGAVVASGGRMREIQVVFDQQKVQKYELSTGKILNLLKAENVELPAGRISDTKKEYSVRLLAKLKDAADIGNIIVANREGRFIKIKDVAQVADSYEEQRVITRFNGNPCVTLSFLKQPNANTVEVVSKINKRAKELIKKKIIPDDVNYAVASSQSYYIENSVKNVGSSAVMGGILAILTIWFFLYTIKRTLVIAVAIPVSILGTFILMSFFDVTLNIFSLGGLVLAVGMLVDNAIVMLENITRHQSDTDNSLEAAHIGSKEVTSALIASTLTNLAAIVPFFFIKGIASLLFRDMVVTVTVAFIISLIVSLTVVPCLSAHLFKNKKEVENDSFNKRVIEKGIAVYKKLLKRVLTYRGIAIIGVVILFMISIFLARTLGREFLPQIDDGKITIKVKLPVGSALEKTDAVAKKLEGVINTMPGVKKISSMVGGYWKKRNVYEKANESDIIVELAEKSKRPLPTATVIKKLQKQLKDSPIKSAKIKVMRTPLRGIKTTSTSDIDIRIRGYNLDKLFGIAKDIQDKIKDVEGLTNIDLSVDFSRPEIHIFLDREKLNDFNLTARDVSDVIRTSVDGLVGTQFTDKERNIDYDIRVLSDPLIVNDIEAVKNILLYPPSGVEVKLKEVANIKVSDGPVQIDREDQVRLIGVTGDAVGKNVGKVTNEIKKRLSSITLPPGYFLEYGGEEESARESNVQLIMVVVLAVFLLFVVMAVQYDSLIDPVIIMVTLPLALMGAFLLLVVTKTPFGATVFLGLILLVGIVVNNAIVMIEYMNYLRKEKCFSVYDSVIEGASLRVRPILMTSLTTIVGLLPLVFGWGEGLEMLKPLAITVVGGLSGAMFLTLFIVPCLYLIIHKEYGGKRNEC
ncbi:MAG: efflux RND transporter permease subunit [Candidatus Omnitrophica bacterium]|nr:efflux RND transporter permease subunit [Candidatus Omnitrophota bacterium]